MKRQLAIIVGTLLCLGWSSGVGQAEEATAIGKLLAGDFQWALGPPVLAPLQRPGDFFYSVKDPSVVRFDGCWHLFCTIRGEQRSHQIEYLAFEDWSETDRAKRHLLKMHDGYFCAPQVVYFPPHRQ